MHTSVANLQRDLLAFIAQDGCTDGEFNAMALQLFAHQFKNNLPFQRFCMQRGKTLRNVKNWTDIPAVPIDGFKDLSLSCTPIQECERVFMTSGTTRADVKGRHHHPTLEVWDASMRRGFSQFFMRGSINIRMAVLFPDETIMANSSLAHYLAMAVREFGAPGSGYFLDANGLQIQSLAQTLTQAVATGEPMAILGASYSFVHLMDALQVQNLSFKLPAGSRLFDTGGFKGQSRELAMDDFYDQLANTFGVARKDCINMYGMTELSSQFYDDGNQSLPSVKRGPHWIRSQLVDPVTGNAVASGERGILAHCDLANYNSVTSILTEDVGQTPPQANGGFFLHGRAQGAQAKGCSLAIDEFLRAAKT
ncbi:hypothetical protein HC248_02288 [Polaromonas vacuolata]|uniref:Acyl-protein synthetase LuxE domain-containing protein n=1 Tax=Polaromonas vacuolata TaxID=37448 RepID=A0A6H2HB35_9BURK|nr:long-chain fatty acid--CoA ligase [Polaromonas vacuolata]QJC56977.1 hypothetical protein HC248_02288 [Polaromonas vacuolata]